MNLFHYMNVFAEVAEASSIAKVANKKGISSAAISKQIATLEQHLNTALFHRSNRCMTLTGIGEIYLAQCKIILDATKTAERLVSKIKKEPEGTLHISSGRYFAEKFLIPRLTEFAARYNKLMLDISVAETLPSFNEAEIDVAFGSYKSPYPDLVCRKITESRHTLCASPAYLKKHGVPKSPKDLHHHRYITHSFRKLDNVLLFRDKEQITITPTLRLNDAGSMHQAAIHGAGIISLNHYIVEESLQKNLLVELLSSYQNAPRPIYLMYRKPRYIEPKIRCFVDFISSIQEPGSGTVI